MAYIEWGPEYALGIKSIDEQHQQLFRYVNELHESMRRNKSKEVLSELLNKLIDYARDHFALEEKYMTQFGYKEMSEHHNEHARFASRIAEFKSSYNLASGMVPIELMHFLKEWLMTHTTGTDKKYVPLFLKKGVK